MIFGNGASEQYEYDALDNLSSLWYNNSSTPAFTWTYDISGLLKSRYDAASRITETYEYDSYSRLSSSTLKQTVDVYDEYEYEPSGTSLVTRLTTTYSYDNYGRTSSVGYAFANKSYTRSVVYGPSDRINSYSVSGALSKVNSYDALNRLSNVSLKNASNSEVIGTSYSYIGMLPSSEISSFTELYYTYDAANRITRIAEYGDDVACYTYDAQGQLIREDNAAANKTWIYTYDNYGNILTKSTYDFTTDDLEYLGSPYSVKTWNYTSSPIGKQLYQSSYDALGNPTYDHERSWSYTWNGRQLTEIMGDGGSPIFRARYNQDGIRTYKEYAEDGDSFVRHDYVLEGSLILQEHAYSFYSSDPWEDPVTYYTNYYYYDENGSLVGLNYNGTNYYYYKNILGDILGIVNSSGALVVEYTYDAWGNILSVTGSLASTLGQANPFRYRGYYYDAETGFYYLNSRYYDPSSCRFINADSFVSTGQGILGHNLYSYCLNNPTMRSDHSGQMGVLNPQLLLYEKGHKLYSQYDYYILSAAQEYGVDPAVIASVISVEQVYNYNIFDLADTPAALIGIDTSIGRGQVKMSTAKFLESNGYIEKSSNWIHRIARLNDLETNIRYVAAYLAYMRDIWIKECPDFEKMPDVWWTVYNIGAENAHPTPLPGRLSKQMNLYYNYYNWRYN